jgi:hypothetical protein
MRDPKALALFQEIKKKTEAGSLKWQETADENHFIAPMLGKYTLKLRPFRSYWGDDQAPSVLVESEQGKVILEINSEVDGIKEDELRALLIFARRVAINADEKIDELIKGIQELPEEDIPF